MNTNNHADNSRDLFVISGLLLLFGIIYALIISAFAPHKPRYTWVSVVVGDAATDLGTMALLRKSRRGNLAPLLPFWAHFLTGGPMILAQVLKHLLFDDASQLMDEYRRG
jgi:hypothetical protein